MNSDTDIVPSLISVIGRALLGKCPNCGKGHLFASYLKQVQNCTVCGESYGHVRADDGPAWLTILLVGHIVVPALVIVQKNVSWPVIPEMIFWFGLTILLALAILPRAKAFFIAVIWYTKVKKRG